MVGGQSVWKAQEIPAHGSCCVAENLVQGGALSARSSWRRERNATQRETLGFNMWVNLIPWKPQKEWNIYHYHRCRKILRYGIAYKRLQNTCLSSLVVSFVGSSYSMITIWNVFRNLTILVMKAISGLLESCSWVLRRERHIPVLASTARPRSRSTKCENM